ncbi:hypothetical protein SPRG_10771 [Saprolegnia parasitica CBS 223.65]|uniref:intramembrane prenyl-peptidase Rce1 n=1 Tax=Saprolegnia parasitica (strain CBS 223.65) TaxID=695850 RepID=A0A067CAK5_SAPPC|nr:hypothetical protein SPRG_10771 [Saprolegnia parasitica CBS 223.65]KDO23576.1 hypothetical protein SPRG_10771 [Saprolegnia parasitica CBS 223.65]|eukprot:XP_012205725.1 hypothetical protein SPRG_10771 [Saprolegnia parasitica CBS 223.65]
MKFAVTPAQAVLSCLGMASAYVGILYCAPRSIRALPRDHPSQIIMRFFLISVVSSMCPLCMLCFYEPSANGISLAAWLGFHWDVRATLVGTFLSLCVTMLLFAGALFAYLLELQATARTSSWSKALEGTSLAHQARYERIQAIRTYLYAPFTEEFVFRSCMAPLLLCAGFSASQIIVGSPSRLASVPHMHHFVEHVRSGMPWTRALLIVVFQLCYTTVFGIYVTFLYLRTGQFWALFVVHAFCNTMGFPDLGFLSSENPLFSSRYAILLVYLLGIVGFSVLLYPLTDPSLHPHSLWLYAL